MRFWLDSPLRRIAFAVGISLLLHGLVLWGPEIRLPRFKSSLPTLTAKLEALPAAPAKPRHRHKAKPSPRQDNAKPTTQPESPPPAPVETETPVSGADEVVERPPLPRHAELTFAINKGTSDFRVGEAIHTLDIKQGRYVLQAITRTVGLAKLFKSYELNQYSNGVYSKAGLMPELFLDESKDKLNTMRNAVELDRIEQRARFSHGGDVPLPADTQDILSIMYQFPPLKGVETASVHVSNGKKIEQYEFEISTEEVVETPVGKLLAVRLRKMHAPNEEGLEIWLAREYRLFPVKMRFIEKNGEVAAEAIITDIRVSEELGERNDAAD